MPDTLTNAMLNRNKGKRKADDDLSDKTTNIKGFRVNICITDCIPIVYL